MTEYFPSYYHSMDREYFKGGEIPAMGISTPPMEDQLAALKMRIRQGVTVVELGFTGAGKGNMGGKATTPEMYGKEEREAIKELAKINKVQLSTHATVGVMGLAGLGEGGFNDDRQEQTLHEIERAIDFAADTARGGAVVVHTGEWQRPLIMADQQFSAYPTEKDKGSIFLARKDTGQLFGVNKEMIVWEPKVKVWKWDNGKKVPKEYEFNPETGDVILEKKTFDQMVDYARELDPSMKDKKDEEVFIKHYFEVKKMEAEAYSQRWLIAAKEYRKNADKIHDKVAAYESLLGATPEEDRWKVVNNFRRQMGLSEDVEDPAEYLKEHEKELLKQVEWEEKAALGSAKQAKEVEYDVTQLRPIEEVGLKRSAQTLARAAIFAYEESKEKNLEKPLFVAPEAWQPEHWGSHPKEMERLIKAGRDQMSDELVGTRGLSREEADKVAKQHIKATFDVGHAYTWRKFFEPKAGEKMEDTDKRFNKWLLSEVRELAEKGIIGHVHLSDNFGYYDEHLTPGMGKAPIKEFLEEMKKAGVEVNAIVEPAHQDIRALHGAMGNLGSPVYGLGKWADIEQSYFGRTQPPYFATEAFMPVQREWQVSYFGIPFE